MKSNRKEYNNRQDAKLINPPVTLGELIKRMGYWDGICHCNEPIPIKFKDVVYCKVCVAIINKKEYL